mmetsp:Transcript_33935/g.67215  ORF Transcript_33935/g.67215 Transcript_33935/m.67215 type:complete len:177 (+) Transcript_33935:147-677(+)
MTGKSPVYRARVPRTFDKQSRIPAKLSKSDGAFATAAVVVVLSCTDAFVRESTRSLSAPPTTPTGDLTPPATESAWPIKEEYLELTAETVRLLPANVQRDAPDSRLAARSGQLPETVRGVRPDRGEGPCTAPDPFNSPSPTPLGDAGALPRELASLLNWEVARCLVFLGCCCPPPP